MCCKWSVNHFVWQQRESIFALWSFLLCRLTFLLTLVSSEQHANKIVCTFYWSPTDTCLLGYKKVCLLLAGGFSQDQLQFQDWAQLILFCFEWFHELASVRHKQRPVSMMTKCSVWLKARNTHHMVFRSRVWFSTSSSAGVWPDYSTVCFSLLSSLNQSELSIYVFLQRCLNEFRSETCVVCVWPVSLLFALW